MDNADNHNGKLAFHVSDFCRAIGISRSTFYKLIGENRIKTITVGGRRLVPATEAHRLASEGCE